jgi:hypothetical protein
MRGLRRFGLYLAGLLIHPRTGLNYGSMATHPKRHWS